MKRYLMDTNALISFVTDRNPEQQEKVAWLFELAQNLKAVILCHQHVLTEFIYVMDRIYDMPKDQINRMVFDLIEMPGVETVQEIDMKAALSFWPDPIPDFGDAVIAASGMNQKGCAIVTFDRKFIASLKSLGLNTYQFD
jgi:predicted nucleic-acid-binding protein